MTEQSKHFCRTAGLAIAIVMIGIVPFTEAQGAGLPDNPVLRENIVSEAQALYGLTEQQAIKRLEAEYAAAKRYRLIRHTDIAGFAGSWFGETDWTLHVALSSSADSALVQSLGATPEAVTYSLQELKAARRQAEASLARHATTRSVLRSSRIDYQSNQVVLGVVPGAVVEARSVVASLGLDSDMIVVTEDATKAYFASVIRGADGTRNYTWYQIDGAIHPCSIGTSIVGGYVTAGHCGYTGNDIRTPSGQSLGVVANSTAQKLCCAYQYQEDGAWVDTTAAWTPTPQINNYGPGVLHVNAKWSGMLEAPVNTTACRYGQISGGPHCGQITSRNASVCFVLWPNACAMITSLIETSGACIMDGDSGGTLEAHSGQVQGTLSGGDHNSCGVDSNGDGDVDDPSDTAYFQPIQTTLDRFQPNGHPRIMLTTHGANKPTINGFGCTTGVFGQPNHFVCTFDNYESQGKTDWLWSTGARSSSWRRFSGFCSPGLYVYVNLTMTNPYGTRHKSTSFRCPGTAP